MKPQYRTIVATFLERIDTLDKIFDDPESWVVSTLKGWVDCYESSRFTQIDDHIAVITSEYKIANVYGWLAKHTVITKMIED